MDLKTSVKLALLNVMKESITDVEVFKRPFELEFLKKDEYFNLIKGIIEQRFISAFKIISSKHEPFTALKELKINPLRSILVPKKTLFDFRKCGYIEPLDEIIYLSLAIMLSNKIEKERIHKKSKIVYSYRLKPDLIKEQKPTYLFDLKMNYTSFRNDVSNKIKDPKIKVVVSCDISNFYDRLNLHRLENTLLAIHDIDIQSVKLLNEMLLYWSNRDSYGIPVGSNASRILAEASLINVDKYLLDKGINFSRYVDDFRLFASSASQAHSWLSILVERLNQEGLFLNTSKTSIVSASEIKQSRSVEISQNQNTDVEMEKNELPLIIRGYSGLIPTKFRKLSNREKTNLSNINIVEDKERKIDIDLVDPKNLLKYIRTLVAQEEWKELATTSTVLRRFPQFTPYYLDCIIKHADSLKVYKNLIIETIIELANDSSILEYLRIYVIRFLSNEIFLSKKVVINSYYQLKRSEGVYLGRAVLECIENYVIRDDLLEIKKDFVRADSAEKRQILKLLKLKLNENEFNAFYKNISLNDNDPWYDLIAKMKKPSEHPLQHATSV
jgi:Reverse transcriptase (RNA-dependent DNA polymerase).